MRCGSLLALLASVMLWFGACAAVGAAESKSKAERPAGRAQTPPPTHPPLQGIEISVLPAGQERTDVFLLLGQSNMKGRGVMPEEPARDPRIAMMHLRDDLWYVARHPLHLVGDPLTFHGADNAGVGPGLAFARARLAHDPKARVALVPCAVGGSSIRLWHRGARLYDAALRRALLARQATAAAGGVIRGVLWLQGEADATAEGLPEYEASLLRLVDDLRVDLGIPDLPFLACTIGEMRREDAPEKLRLKSEMNRLLLSLPSKRAWTDCVDARDLTTHLGDFVHFDSAAQEEIGRRYAHRYLELGARRQGVPQTNRFGRPWNG